MCSILFVEDDVDDLVDVKGSHEDIYDFARKADIVVCCLTLNNETVEPLPIFFHYLFLLLSEVPCLYF